MKQKTFLLPRMAANNICKNKSSYFPYIGVSIFAIFTYFVFDLIQKNDIMYTLPKGAYALVMVQLGFMLLGVIMVPFLYYTNSFLIKRRKKELGLYSILGLEKKHIGIMMLWESLGLYVIVLGAAFLLGLLFSRLIFLVLLNLVGMSVDVEFAVSPAAFSDTAVFYAFVTGLNLFVNLIQVGKSNPVELMGDAKGGEKEPRHILLWSLVGLLFLGAGYATALNARINNMIFTNFFLAVFSVVLGSYFLFTSGSVALLKLMKKNRRLYYTTEHFVTVSGMLYRMKKSAASLSNICIFGTMVIITLSCTVSLYLGLDRITGFMYPHTMEIAFVSGADVDREALGKTVYAAAKECGVTLEDFTACRTVRTGGYKQENTFCMPQGAQRRDFQNQYDMCLMTLEEYNLMEGKTETLEQDEVFVYSTGPDFGYEAAVLGGVEYRVRQELADCRFAPKAAENAMAQTYMFIFADEERLREAASLLGVSEEAAVGSFDCGFTPVGDDSAVDAFYGMLGGRLSSFEGFASFIDRRTDIADTESMYGGLLFIGIFFGLIFMICLLIIMYYKQITEGYEDQRNFEIMQKVGMSDDEIKSTIRKQIRLVFALPLAGALMHTAVGMKMVILLMGCISFYESRLILCCGGAVCLLFAVFYSLGYKRTSAVYYRIVRQMG